MIVQTQPLVTKIGTSVHKNANAETPTWQQSLKQAVRDPIKLCQELELPEQYWQGAQAAALKFPVFVPRGFLQRIEKGNVNDPLLRQVLPLADEELPVPGFVSDPVGDTQARIIPGMLQKYQSRVLLITTGVCAVHCRYCFRREYPYSDSPKSVEAWRPAFNAIAGDPEVNEVILSGGDPLMLVDSLLEELMGEIAAISHVRRLRIHTRLPIMIPERVTDRLLAVLRSTRLTTIMIVHSNHAAEIDSHVEQAFARLIDSGIPVLNQAVLLRGVNDSVEALQQLSERLVDLRVMPYYLHQLDQVQGSAHFEVPVATGRELIRELRKRLSGYAVPQYVQEIAGEPHKTPLM